MRVVSLNARKSHDDEYSSESPAFLCHITHPSTNEVIRITTSPKELLTENPDTYGIRSSWRSNDEPYEFLLMSALLPSDKEDAQDEVRIILSLVSSRIIEVLRSTNEQATAHMALVMESTPDLVEAEIVDLKLIGIDADATQVSLILSRQPITEEAWPCDRTTKQRFPGQHR